SSRCSREARRSIRTARGSLAPSRPVVDQGVSKLPPCGLYRTTMQIGGIEAGRLVYFHDHGNPGPGLYLPDSWKSNRAHFSSDGMTAPTDLDPRALQALPAEGFYRVTAAF